MKKVLHEIVVPLEKIAKMILFVSVLCAQNAFAGDPFVGAKIYNEHCMRCHGADGKAVIAGTPDFLHTNLLAKPDFRLVAFIKSGSGIMPSYEGVLKEQELHDVIAYIRTFN